MAQDTQSAEHVSTEPQTATDDPGAEVTVVLFRSETKVTGLPGRRCWNPHGEQVFPRRTHVRRETAARAWPESSREAPQCG